MEHGSCGHNWATLGKPSTETWSSRLGVGRKPDDLALQKIIILKSNGLKTGCNLKPCLKKGCFVNDDEECSTKSNE
jgi:hypothetical protein